MHARRWAHGVVGIWTIVSAFLDMPHPMIMTNLIIVGIIILILGFPEKSVRDDAEYQEGT